MGYDLAAGRVEIDAEGKLVLPGGVDGHCHFDEPMPDGVRMADDFESGTRAAACGGTTTVIPFAVQVRGDSPTEAVADYHRRSEGRALVDYAFHLILTDPTDAVLGEELPALIAQGYTSFKLYMTYDYLKLDDGQILRVLDVAREHGALAMVHAENSDAISWLTAKLEHAGKTAPGYHAVSRPPAVEREAAHRAITMSELCGVPILIVHVSGRETIEQIRWARGRGLRIYAETCPHYLFLTADDLGTPGSFDDGDPYRGAKCVCSPPPRDVDSQRAVWDGLADGLFTIVSSDHAPFRYDGSHGKQLRGGPVPFRYIPNGVPGIETRLPLLFSEGVGGGRISLNQFVALTATNPAKLFGLHPRKGTIAVGSDADIAIWEPHLQMVIRNENLHHAVDYTPYEGRTVTGWPVLTMVRGEVVCRDGSLVAAPGHGRFVACEPPAMARPMGF
jgi:dihydropyrimidinase